MELIYIHIDKYRNFRNIDLPISGKFNVIYDENNENILIEKNANYMTFYITVLTGGSTSLLMKILSGEIMEVSKKTGNCFERKLAAGKKLMWKSLMASI